MKLLLLSDLHLLYDRPVGRKDDILQTQKDKVDYIFNFAAYRNCIILQAGDFFDVPRSWRLLPMYIDILKDAVQNKGLGIYAIYGQHDTYLYSESTRNRTMLGVLSKMELIKILGVEGTRIGENVCVYGASYGQNPPVPKSDQDLNILVIHAPLLKKRIWKGQKGPNYADEFLLAQEAYTLVLCGDIHQKFLFETEGRIICNTGCILRKSVDQWGYKPGFYIYDTETREIEWHEIPHRPPEEIMSREHLDEVEAKSLSLSEFTSMVKNIQVDSEDPFKKILIQVLTDNDIEEDVRIAISEVMSEVAE